MSQQLIGQGPGNLVPDSEVKQFLANGAVVKGDVLALTGTTGYTVDQCTATTKPIGVAAESGTDVWIDVVVSGFCSYITTDGGVAAGQALIPAAAGVCDSETLDTNPAFEFGLALAADVSTVLSAALIFKTI